MGSDPTDILTLEIIEVSIHAPAWGATIIQIGSNGSKMFQSTLPHGERLVGVTDAVKALMFQSTLPHGERRAQVLRPTLIFLFLSTLPHGERLNFDEELLALAEFQSTLPHGERRVARLS